MIEWVVLRVDMNGQREGGSPQQHEDTGPDSRYYMRVDMNGQREGGSP